MHPAEHRAHAAARRTCAAVANDGARSAHGTLSCWFASPLGPRDDSDRRRSRATADHGVEIWAPPVLRSVRVVDGVVDLIFDRFIRHVPRHPGRDDSAALLV